jgi:3-hydroxyisobutyrate dehydrogenase-like beta-hydroxyacid dehydrogenase
MKVGFIGLGRMGMPMCVDLLKAGFELTVHNRSRGKVDEMAKLGAIPAWSPAEVTQASDIVLACLPDVSTVEQVFLGERGVVPHARPGQVLVDHSTINPSTARKIAAAAETRGASFLDAPLTGRPGRDSGANTLSIIVGGESSAYEKALPVFQAMSDHVRHLGPSGAGSAMKLVNSLVVCINVLAAAEGFLLAVKLGVHPQFLPETLNRSAARSPILSYVSTRLLERNFEGDQIPLRLALKDLELACELATDAGIPLFAAPEALKMFQEAVSRGFEEQDFSSIYLVLEEMAEQQASSS